MKKRWKFTVMPILFAGGVWLGSIVSTNADGLVSSNQPGSAEDPIVTKSYVDQRLKELIQEELSRINGGRDVGTGLTDEPAGQDKDKNKDTGDKGQAAPANFTVVKLGSGQMLYAGAGTEFIVRTGKAVAFSGDENGIPDLTAGKDIAAGEQIELNHLLMFPREGRGIKPAPGQKADIFVMIKGNYLLMNADGTKATP